jgi:tetratricopeptide (TPR) repeat protein
MRKVWLVALILLFAAAGVHLALRRPTPAWTTSSPTALSEFEQALDAEAKFYRSDAVRHLRRALELDAEFVAPKLWLQYFPDLVNEKEREQLFGELEQADLSRLSARERFILSYRLANRERDFARASKILDEYLAANPEDPWALRFVVAKAWNMHDWPLAERLYKQLVERDPNFVLAHNHLGYIYMAQGRFQESEEAFRTYRFIAPDQANPHDSLGELLTLRGRYQEAVEELEASIAVKGDFCASYEHLVTVYELWRRPAAAAEVVDRAAKADACPPDSLSAQRCRVDVWGRIQAEDWAGAWEQAQRCDGRQSDPVLVHLVALRTGNTTAAEAIEADFRQQVEGYAEKGKEMDAQPKAMLAHLEGARALADGRLGEAIARFQEADSLLQYWASDAILKLYNQSQLVAALVRAGDLDDARRAYATLTAVNPDFAPGFLTADVLAAVGGVPAAATPPAAAAR